MVTLGDTPDSATANLLAPVLVNHRTQRAGQYLLSDLDLPMRAPLSSALGLRARIGWPRGVGSPPAVEPTGVTACWC